MFLPFLSLTVFLARPPALSPNSLRPALNSSPPPPLGSPSPTYLLTSTTLRCFRFSSRFQWPSSPGGIGARRQAKRWFPSAPLFFSLVLRFSRHSRFLSLLITASAFFLFSRGILFVLQETRALRSAHHLPPFFPSLLHSFPFSWPRFRIFFS